jgi:hypothetical protein
MHNLPTDLVLMMADRRVAGEARTMRSGSTGKAYRHMRLPYHNQTTHTLTATLADGKAARAGLPHKDSACHSAQQQHGTAHTECTKLCCTVRHRTQLLACTCRLRIGKTLDAAHRMCSQTHCWAPELLRRHTDPTGHLTGPCNWATAAGIHRTGWSALLLQFPKCKCTSCRQHSSAGALLHSLPICWDNSRGTVQQ